MPTEKLGVSGNPTIVIEATRGVLVQIGLSER